MSSAGSQTLDRIQQEIQEALRREEELREVYSRVSTISNNNRIEPTSLSRSDYASSNGSQSPTFSSPSPVPSTESPPPSTNGFRKNSSQQQQQQQQRFAPNPSAKGVMQKFLRMRGKVNMVTIKPNVVQQSQSSSATVVWNNNNISDDAFEPAKVTVEAGKCIRNGFVSAEEKMRKELLEFQEREAELRRERRKSQPDLMAALETEKETETNLKPARSMAQMYSTEDLTDEDYGIPNNLKQAKSLADLCDVSDEELDVPGTHSLIMQFENLGNRRA